MTYQDYESAGNKPEFYLKTIEEYRGSETYQKAVTAQAYYARKNTVIVNRLTFMQKYGIKDSKIKFFKTRNGFFPKSIKQEAQYLLGNGVTLDEAVKEKLGAKFDKDFQRMGMQALVDGVNWGFWNVDRLLVFRATEFVPLFDELTGDMRLGIRFWQIDMKKPLYIEVYAEDGIHKYKTGTSKAKLEHIGDASYKQRVRQDGTGVEVVDTENYPTIPVFPLYANDLHVSELSDGLQEDIDAYDFINSDLVDGATLIDGVYWVVKNYGGNDAAQLVHEIQALKTMMADGSNAGAEGTPIEVPYQAKKTALDLLMQRMYEESMTFNTKALTGGSLTNVAINVAKTDLDLKADIFEWQCADFVQRVLSLIGIKDAEPKFKRRSITNDTENINNLSTQLADGYIDAEFAVKHAPNIPDDEQDELLQRLAIEQQKQANEDMPIEEKNDEEPVIDNERQSP